MKATVNNWHRLGRTDPQPCELSTGFHRTQFTVMVRRPRKSDPQGPDERLTLRLDVDAARELHGLLGAFLVPHQEGSQS
jgi:hypothetical protein